MEMKDLNKSQLILLAILLSFITSIATGITTVTLMQQAPSSVTTPINNVIRQTVEKIQQVEGKTQTVVIKEEDLVVDAIAKNQGAVFALSKLGLDASGNTIETPAGRAFAVSAKDNIIVGDAASAPEEDDYFVGNASGKFKAEFILSDERGFSFLKIGEAVNGTDKLVISMPAPGDLSKLKVRQKGIVLGSTISSTIFEGDTDIDLSLTNNNAGGLVLNLDGESLGIALSDESLSFASMAQINDALATVEVPAN
jgi:hypothetical protein